MFPAFLPTDCPPFARQDAEDFFRIFRKIEEIRLGIRKSTPEDNRLYFEETVTKLAWLGHPETQRNPAAEGRRIAKLMYECALDSGGDTKYILEEYWPDHFRGCENWGGLGGKKSTDPKDMKFRDIIAAPFFGAALEIFNEMNASRQEKEESRNKSKSFGEKEAASYFKDLGVIFKAMQAKSSLSRPFTPQEQLIIDSTEHTEKSWLENPELEDNPVEEGKRMGKLLYKHASIMEDEREFAMESYFPEHLKMSAVQKNVFGGKTDDAVESFLANALSAFVEARDEEENWVDV